MALYNLTGIIGNGSNASMLTFTQGVNTYLLFGWLGALVLLGLSVVLFTSFMFTTNDVNKALIGTSFIAFVMSLSFRALDLLPNLGVFVCLIILALSLAITWRRD